MARHPSSVHVSVCLSVNFLRKSLLLRDKWLDYDQIAHDDVQVSVHPGCAQGQGHGHVTYMIAQKSLLLTSSTLMAAS